MNQLKQFSIPTLILIIPMLELPIKSSNLNPVPTTFQPIISPTPVGPSLSPSSHTDATPILSPLSSNEPDIRSPILDDQLELDLEAFINPQRQIHNTNNPFTFHQLTHSTSTSESSILSVQIAFSRA